MQSIAHWIQQYAAARPALQFRSETVTYGELAAHAGAISRALTAKDGGPLSVVAVLAEKSKLAYSAIVGAHGAGYGYVPLNPRFPTIRLASMLNQSKTGVLFVGAESIEVAGPLLEAADRALVVVHEPSAEIDYVASACPRHRFVSLGEARPEEPCVLTTDATAYLLFTSGSTGVPKGVPVSHGNLASYLSAAEEMFLIEPNDRCSQSFALTFDLSVHDIFLTLRSGACLCPLDKNDLLTPARFIRDQALTVWFSVPALAMVMARTRTLRPELFPTLRLSLFCGEALPVTTAESWAAAAPHSRLINLYGPTEATIAITSYEWKAPSGVAFRHGIAPIGTPFPRQQCVLVGEDGEIVVGTGGGELLLAGDQVTGGYLDNPERTKAQFVNIKREPHTVFYRTGDLVERDATGLLHYIGRLDSQIKLRGHRIELQEIDQALRSASGSDLAVGVPVPGFAQPEAIVAAIAGLKVDPDTVLARCKDLLPEYMVPTSIQTFDVLPVNSTGKIDRQALAKLVNDA